MTISLIAALAVSGCTTGDSQSVVGTPTATGWKLPKAELPAGRSQAPVGVGSSQWTVETVDATPTALLLVASWTPRQAERTYLVERATGRIRWSRDGVRSCFLETPDRVWCIPEQDQSSALESSSWTVIDESNRAIRQLAPGRATAAASDLARSRGDEGAPTIATITSTPGFKGSRPFHRIEVRSRIDNRLILVERPSHESNSLVTSVQTFRNGFATSISEAAAPESRLYDNSGRLLATVPGLVGAGLTQCQGLPVMRVGTGATADDFALIEPATGKVVYRKSRPFDYDPCGPDYLTDGPVFVEADGRARHFGIGSALSFSNAKILVAGRSTIIVVDGGVLRVFRRATLALIRERRLPHGTEVARIDHRAVLLTNPDGVEYVQA